MNLRGPHPMIEALEEASSLQLYQLQALIQGMLSDPRRGIAARASLHLGQPVHFVDFRDGQMRRGKIIAMRDTQATVLEEGTKRTWKIPCLAMQGYDDVDRQGEHAPYEPPPEPVRAASPARQFERGDTATFDDKMVTTSRACSCESISAPPPLARVMARHGGFRFICCAAYSTSEHGLAL